MRAVGITRFGGPEVLQIVERPVPEPGDGEVRIRVAAATVNPSDTVLRSGRFGARRTERGTRTCRAGSWQARSTPAPQRRGSARATA